MALLIILSVVRVLDTKSATQRGHLNRTFKSPYGSKPCTLLCTIVRIDILCGLSDYKSLAHLHLKTDQYLLHYL